MKDTEKVPTAPELVTPVTDFDPLPASIFTEAVQLDKGRWIFLMYLETVVGVMDS